MKGILFLLMMLLGFGCGFRNGIESIKLRKLKSEFIETENYGVRKKPILNREYLIFLCWQIDVYGESYPERIFEMLPKGNDSTFKNHEHQVDFEKVFELLNNKIFKGYISNPKYLNYPVIGLTSKQIIAIQKWMSDRFNENLLIEFGHLNFNPYQRDEDCFVLESYLIDQYQGDLRSDKKVYWKDNKFLPGFRLPYQYELGFVKLNLKNKISIREYKFTSKDFLSKWDKHFISVDNPKNEIYLKLRKPFRIKNESAIKLNTELIKDEILTNDNEVFVNFNYLDQIEFKEKDRYGMQPYFIIGENNFDRPIIATQNKTQKDTILTNKIFWVVYQKIIDFKDWPRK